MVLPPVPDVVSVPETAVDQTLYGDSVFVVAEDGKDADGKPKHKAVQTFVETGAAVRGPGRDRPRRGRRRRGRGVGPAQAAERRARDGGRATA